jgi:hypothetical protein
VRKKAYESDIVLGEKYREKRTGLEGTATSIHFYENACERVVLMYLHDGDIKEASFDAVEVISAATGKVATSSRPGGPARTMPPRR